MPEILKPVPLEKALLATRESMAVKRELAHLLTAQVTDRQSAISYEADLGTFKLGTEFTFWLGDVQAETVLHFEDLNITLKAGDPPIRIRAKIPSSGENAITLVTHCNDEGKWHAKFTVDAQGVGRIIEHDGGSRDEEQSRRRVFIWRFRSVAQRPMVGWYDPPLLLRTESEIIVSTLFGGHSDYRLLEALAAEADTVHDYRGYYLEDKDGQYIVDE